MRYLLFVICCWLIVGLQAQQVHNHAFTRVVRFPNIPGYVSVKCDFHIHTVFSDGSVWPDIRVEEALKDSLDMISLTEHLEYQPHIKDIPHPDRNRSFEVGAQAAKPYGLTLVNGSEITRSMPPGHNNAIFIKDANKLLMDDPIAVFKEANQQGAFVFWNHSNWIAQQRDGISKLTDMHRQLIGDKLLHGIEVVNDLTYSAEALQIALDNNLTIMGTSDIHGLVDWQYGIADGGHRPLTLVFATDKSETSVKEALFAGRTAVWYNNLLIGREMYLVPLIQASLSVVKANYQGISSVVDVDIKNTTGVDFILVNQSPYSLHTNDDVVIVKAYDTTRIEVKTLEQLENFNLTFKVMNGIVAPKTHPNIDLNVTVKK
jgi:hypothetical protein